MAKKCNIKFPVKVKGKIADVLAKVKAAAKSRDVKFEGDVNKGTFSGDATGSYTVDGQDITITVTEKPWLATDGMVKDAVTTFFAGL